MIIHLCPLDALDDDLRQRYRDTLLSAEEVTRLGQFKRQQAADQFLAGRALLRSTFGELFARNPRALQLEHSAEGKPSLRDNDGWHFNLSHSNDWVALALSRDGEVGVDIESSARRNNVDGIAERFFRPEESAWLQSLPETQRREKFFQMWTVKEATVKALGTGIAGALIEAGVTIERDRPVVTLTGAIARSRPPLCWHTVLTTDVTPHHLAAVLLTHHENFAANLQPALHRTVPLSSSQHINPTA